MGGRRRNGRAGEAHAPVLRRLRHAGHDPRRFRDRATLPWFLLGGVLLALLSLGPILWPTSNVWAHRVATVLALFFFLAAVGYAFRMGHRALLTAGVLVMLLYAATGWTALIDVRDVFVLTVILGFLLFTLAGFNLLFVLEEMVYDAHRLMHLRNRAWAAVPLLVTGSVVVFRPLVEMALGIGLPTLGVVAPPLVLLLLVGWGVAFGIRRGRLTLMREIHLLVVGAMAGAALADAVGLLHRSSGLIPSVLVYLSFLGTWVYISFTTLQRAQYFLRSNDISPWVALLLSATFAGLAHVSTLYEIGGERAIEDLVDLRVSYLILGVWIGLAFVSLRGLWRVFRSFRDERRLGARTRMYAGRLARLTEGLLGAERKVGDATLVVFQAVERAIPGHHDLPAAVEIVSDDSEE